MSVRAAVSSWSVALALGLWSLVKVSRNVNASSASTLGRVSSMGVSGRAVGVGRGAGVCVGSIIGIGVGDGRGVAVGGMAVRVGSGVGAAGVGVVRSAATAGTGAAGVDGVGGVPLSAQLTTTEIAAQRVSSQAAADGALAGVAIMIVLAELYLDVRTCGVGIRLGIEHSSAAQETWHTPAAEVGRHQCRRGLKTTMASESRVNSRLVWSPRLGVEYPPVVRAYFFGSHLVRSAYSAESRKLIFGRVLEIDYGCDYTP